MEKAVLLYLGSSLFLPQSCPPSLSLSNGAQDSPLQESFLPSPPPARATVCLLSTGSW